MEPKEGTHGGQLWRPRMVAELCGCAMKFLQGFLGEVTALGSFSSAGHFFPISQELQEAEWKMGGDNCVSSGRVA